MAKITPTEFKKWAEELRELYAVLLKPTSGLSFPDQAAKEKFISLGSITSLYAGQGSTNALFFGAICLEIFGLKQDVPFIPVRGSNF